MLAKGTFINRSSFHACVEFSTDGQDYWRFQNLSNDCWEVYQLVEDENKAKRWDKKAQVISKFNSTRRLWAAYQTYLEVKNAGV